MDTSSVQPGFLQKKGKGRRFETWLADVVENYFGGENLLVSLSVPTAGPAPIPPSGGLEPSAFLRGCHTNESNPSSVKIAAKGFYRVSYASFWR